MKFTQKFLGKNHPSYTGRIFPNGRPETITIHWTGEQILQSPETVWEYFHSLKTQVAAHFIVKNDEVIQCIPLPHTAYHCGNPIGNNTSVAIEVIAENTLGEFSKKSIQTLRELYFLLGQLPLERHFDWNGKDCPRYYLDETRWSKLKSQIASDSPLPN